MRTFAQATRRSGLNQSGTWWRRYNVYLESPEWRYKRELVMRRAAGICEACGEARAVEVHHASYRYVFHEPLFDLHAVCKACHDSLTEMDRRR